MSAPDLSRVQDVLGATEEMLDAFGLTPDARGAVAADILSLKAGHYATTPDGRDAADVLADIRSHLAHGTDHPLAAAICREIDRLLA